MPRRAAQTWMPGEALNTDGIAPPARLFNGQVAPLVDMSAKAHALVEDCELGHPPKPGADKIVRRAGIRSRRPVARKWLMWMSPRRGVSTMLHVKYIAAAWRKHRAQNRRRIVLSQSSPAVATKPRELNDATAEHNCSTTDAATGAYSADCAVFDAAAWNAALRPIAAAVRENSAPVYMGGIHPRLKSKVSRRLAVGAANLVYGGEGPVSGLTVSGCSLSSDGM